VLLGYHVYYAASCLGTELNCTGGECKQCVILATADVYTRVKVGPALANENLTGIDLLAIVTLYAQTLRV
jgi:hypothetical protein